MKTISLSKGMTALVSDEDFEWASQFKWFVTNKKSHGRDLYYAARKSKNRQVSMAREIYERAHGPIPVGRIIDHGDDNKLNNQRWNLSAITHLENMLKCKNWDRPKAPLLSHLTLEGIDF